MFHKKNSSTSSVSAYTSTCTCIHTRYSPSSSSSTESVSSACGSSSVATAGLQCTHVSALTCTSVHLLRQVHTGSLHERTHLQERSCSTASGAGEPRIHSAARFPSSSVVQPQSRWQPDSLHGVCAWTDSSHKEEVGRKLT